MTAIKNTVADLEGQISARDSIICQLQATETPAPGQDTTTTALFPHITTTTNTNYMSEQITDLDKFDGTRSQLCSFLGQL